MAAWARFARLPLPPLRGPPPPHAGVGKFVGRKPAPPIPIPIEGSEGLEGEGIAYGDEYEISVTGFTFVSPKPHSGETEPPFRRKEDENCGGAVGTIFGPNRSV